MPCRSVAAPTDAPTSSSSSGVEAEQGVIKLYYRTSWGNGAVHGSLAGAKWKDFPLSKVIEALAPAVWVVIARVPESRLRKRSSIDSLLGWRCGACVQGGGWVAGTLPWSR